MRLPHPQLPTGPPQRQPHHQTPRDLTDICLIRTDPDRSQGYGIYQNWSGRVGTGRDGTGHQITLPRRNPLTIGLALVVVVDVATRRR